MYSFTGGGLPSDIRTVYVDLFENTTPDEALRVDVQRALQQRLPRLFLRVFVLLGRAARHVPTMISGCRNTSRSWSTTTASISPAGTRPIGQVPAPRRISSWLT